MSREDDLLEDEKFPLPPAYYTEFESKQSMEPPDLSKISQKNYFIFFQMFQPVNVSKNHVFQIVKINS